MRSAESPFHILVRSLRFDEDGDRELRNIGDASWQSLLHMADEARLALTLGIRRRDALPSAVRHRIDRNLCDNARRFTRSIDTHLEISDALRRRGVPFVALKGLSHFPFFCDDLARRQQYDIDLLCPTEHIGEALQAVSSIGYESVARGAAPRTDHLPTMVRKTGWRWRGNYYDPDMPLNLELHFRLWDPGMEMFDISGAEQFWRRRTFRPAGCILIPVLDLQDTIRYAAWHITRHLLRGDLRPIHVYEFAHLLHKTAADDSFWASWRGATLETMLAEALAAKLASECFGCSMNPAVRDLTERFPYGVKKWFELFAISPLLAADRPNKDELLLHLFLAPRLRNKARVAARRLFPPLPARLVPNPHSHSAHLSSSEVWLHNLHFRSERAFRHVRTLGPLALSGLRLIKAALA